MFRKNRKKAKKEVVRRQAGLTSSSSLESITSQTSRYTPKIVSEQPRDQPPPAVASGHNFFDCCAMVVYCPEHGSIGLTQMEHNAGLWLPYVAVQPSEAWLQSIVTKLKQLLHFASSAKNCLDFNEPQLINLLKLQIPGGKFMTRATYFVQIKPFEQKQDAVCCTNTPPVTWHSVDDLPRLARTGLWGPEPYVFSTACASNTIDKGSYTEYTLRDALRYVRSDDSNSVHSQMLKSANFGKNEITCVYAEFMQHVYPAQYMCRPALEDYFTSIGVLNTGMNFDACYRALACNNSTYVSFHEFLIGIAAMDKGTESIGDVGQLRFSFIFRYYDADCDGHLNRAELEKMVADSLHLQNTYDEHAVQKQTNEFYALFGTQMDEPLSYETIVKHNKELILSTTSLLFRSPFSFTKELQLKHVYRSVSTLQAIHLPEGHAESSNKRSVCLRCTAKKYTLAAHIVRVNADGTAENDGLLSRGPDLAFTSVSREKRNMSLQELSSDNPAHKMLTYLRDYGIEQKLMSPKLKSKKVSDFWSKGNTRQLASMVLKLCQDAENIFRRESRCIKIYSPCYVLGDILGNFRDLLIFEKCLWEKGPTFSPSSYLFLGNYTDNGKYNLECLVYLLSCKVLNSFGFFMLRGSKELRETQKSLSLERQCQDKFGRFGTIVWEVCNKVFDSLPLCAVIDESIFCVNSGIPSNSCRIEEINGAPVPLTDPARQFPSALEMLWNDLLSPQRWRQELEVGASDEEDRPADIARNFLPNTRRGIGYYFNEHAASLFLAANGLTHIIRSHEAPRTGYQCHMQGRLVTIFSSSFHHGHSTGAGTVFVEQNKIRIITLDLTSP